MPTVTVDQLKQAITNKLQRVGVSKQHAAIVADVLTFAEERLVKSHGVLRLPHYLNRIEHGSIKVDAEIKAESVNDVIVKIDGDQALGHVVAHEAANYVVDLAQEKGIGVAIVHNTTHSGAIGYYANEIAKQGMIGIIFTQADPLVAPFGGKKAMLGANPIAYGIPTALDYPIVLDISTSEASFGKVMLAREADKKIPTTWGLNENGEPTDDPHAVTALQSMAGAKGYGLAILVDILAGVLAGVPFGKHIEPMYADVKKRRNLGQFFIAINPAYFISTEQFIEQVQQMVQELQQTPTAPGFDKVYVPGERSHEQALRSAQEGIELSDEYYAFLQEELTNEVI